MPPFIEVSRDIANLRIAARELLEESFEQERDERVARLMAESGRDREQPARRTLSPGYYDRAAYLFQLDEMLAVVHFGAHDLAMAEIHGVGAIRQARAEFQNTHPPCPKCGVLNGAIAMRCRKCSAELKR